MSVAKIRLGKRLERIKEGYASDIAFYFAAIRAWMNAPIVSYLGNYDKERKRLYELMAISPQKGNELLYWEVAVAVSIMWKSAENKASAVEMMNILALPFRRCYDERMRKV